jgi:hypothetical protein
VEADELDRIKIIKTLPPFRRGGLAHYMTAALLNSYLVDLYNHTKKENEGMINPATGKMVGHDEEHPKDIGERLRKEAKKK